MKTVVVFASPRKNGNTKKLLDLFIENQAGKIEIINICDINPNACLACGKCNDKSGKCVCRDLDIVLEKIEGADRFIIATPIYNYSFPSQMKAFADRLQPYFEIGLKSDFSDKKGFLLSSCGCSGKFSVDVIKKQSEMIFKELGFEFFGEYCMSNTDKCDFENRNFGELKKSADKFFIL